MLDCSRLGFGASGMALRSFLFSVTWLLACASPDRGLLSPSHYTWAERACRAFHASNPAYLSGADLRGANLKYAVSHTFLLQEEVK